MHTAFGLGPAISIKPLNLNGGRFNTCFFAAGLFDKRDFIALLLSPTHIHALQHTRPILAFRAAGTGMHFQIGIIAVSLARQQGFDFHAFRFRRQIGQRRLALSDDIRIALGFAKFDEFNMLIHLVFKLSAGFDGVFEPRAFLHFGLCRLRVVPQFRVFGELVQRVQLFKRVVPVKDASEANPMTP